MAANYRTQMVLSHDNSIIARQRASTSMYSLTFRVRVTRPRSIWTKWNGARSRRVNFIAGEGSLRRHA